MHRVRSRIGIVCCLLAACCLAILSVAATQAKPADDDSTTAFRVGGAFADITPDHGMPNYNGESLAPDKDATPLRVQAIVLDDGTSRAAIISVDCTFLGRIEVGRMREALHQRLG